MNAMEMRPRLIGRLFRYCRNLTLAEEAVDEAIARIVAMGDRCRSENVWPLMKTIAVNLLRDGHKRGEVQKRRLKAVYFSQPRPQTPVDHAITGELQRTLEAALGVLTDREREVFRLCKLDGLTCRETAQAMQMSEGAVRVMIYRAKYRLRRFLKKFAA